MSRLMSGLYEASEWISRLAYLNILWVLFTLGGLVVFGIFPATASVFTITRYWVMGKEDIPLFKTFWNSYKENFGKVQIIGYVLVAIGAILYYDYQFFSEKEGPMFFVIELLTGSIIFIFSLVVLFIFPVFTHYKLKTIEYFKNTLLISLSQLLLSIVMFIVTGLLVYALSSFSGLLLFFGLSLPAYWITWVAQIIFKRLEELKTAKNG
ncbi:YesL family protein [Salinibacillus xinjiangensis]|uniref:DUF624 domain-containing protein n=1 Tax=Salinibacillus xinjiangensis TaxID=1229268 RepID=A0A6G1XA60_9BACI|nr:DUF624 domain-containing protein [Salinibacillus xinjiangensis]MRG87864.1 DUF624 domain-containing protein [Salinibacillus xinjiangensis]